MITAKQQARAGVLKSLAMLKNKDAREDLLKKQACTFRNQLLIKRAQKEASKLDIKQSWDDLGENKWIGPNGRYIVAGAGGGLTIGMLYGALKSLCNPSDDNRSFGYNLTRYGLKGLVGGAGLGSITAGGSMLLNNSKETKELVNSLPAVPADKVPKKSKSSKEEEE